MPRFSEDALRSFTRPPSDSENLKLENAERMVREAIRDDEILGNRKIDVFGQGSYANDTNVRLNSDIDINVSLADLFYFDLPPGWTRFDFGLNSPQFYPFHEYKGAVENALIGKFGRENVKRNDKCITVAGNSYRVDTDVVPTFSYRRYSDDRSYVEGAKLITESGLEIVNFAKQHILNGKAKNVRTQKRFKRLTRIHRRLRYDMAEKVGIDDAITSFLIECLVWNVPDDVFNNNNTWTERLLQSVAFLHGATSRVESCGDWGEVSELLYLFGSGRKWTGVKVNDYLQRLWGYLEG